MARRAWFGWLPGPVPRLSPRGLAIVVGTATGAVSTAIRPSYDETYWLGIARLVEEGRSLYDGAIDNKTPVVYALAWLLDAMPGPLQLARGVAVGALIGVTAFFVSRLLDCSTRPGPVILVVGGTLAVSSDFVLTTELVAVASLAAALAFAHRSSWMPVAALLVVGAAFDPRIAVLFPGVLLLLHGSSRRRATIAVTLTTLTAFVVVYLTPNLEFGLVAMNLASRSILGGWHPLEAATSLAQTALPLVGLLLLVRPRRPSLPGLLLAAGTMVIGLTSVHPFPHYWTYLVLPLPFMLGEARGNRTGFAVLLLTLTFVPAIVESVGMIAIQESFWDRYGAIDRRVENDERVIVFSLRPHVGTLLADRILLRSPTIQYLTWPSPRQNRYLAELPDLIDEATTIVDTGEFDVSPAQLNPEVIPVWGIMRRRIDEFPCVESINELVIRRRGWFCTDGGP